jgi:hypothetical protein
LKATLFSLRSSAKATSLCASFATIKEALCFVRRDLKVVLISNPVNFFRAQQKKELKLVDDMEKLWQKDGQNELSQMTGTNKSNVKFKYSRTP